MCEQMNDKFAQAHEKRNGSEEAELSLVMRFLNLLNNNDMHFSKALYSSLGEYDSKYGTSKISIIWNNLLKLV